MRFASLSSSTLLVSLLGLGLGLGVSSTSFAQAPAPSPAPTPSPTPAPRANPGPRPTPASITVDVEVTSGGAPLVFSIPLIAEHGSCGSASLDASDRVVELEVCRDATYAGTVLRIEFDERTRAQGKQTGHRRARATAPVPAGQRVVLGRVTSANAPVLELAARVR